MRRYAAIIATVGAAAIALFMFGPAYLRHAGSALFMFSRDVEAAVPYRIDVKPGNATVAKGADQVITAELSGFDAADAVLMVQEAGDGRRVRAVPDGSRRVGRLRRDAVRSLGAGRLLRRSGRRSLRQPITLKVVELPYVQKLQLEYHFPAYTGLPPQKIEDGGDIAVLRGTEVRVRAVPTMADHRRPCGAGESC